MNISDLISNLIKNQKSHHAYIICSLDQQFAFESATKIINDVLDYNSGLFEISCKIIQPEKDLSKSKILIEQIRLLDDFLLQTNLASEFKFIIINSLDDLTINSANALLKNLEEPTKGTYFLMISSSENKILPTIKSRSLVIKLPYLTKEAFDNEISKKKTISEPALRLYQELYSTNLSKILEADEYNLYSIAEKISAFFQGNSSLIFEIVESVNNDNFTFIRDFILLALKNVASFLAKNNEEPSSSLIGRLNISYEELQNLFNHFYDLCHQSEIYNLPRDKVIFVFLTKTLKLTKKVV